MILLSALLASLTGLVSGERPVERAQVERSAVAAVAQAGAVALAVSRHPVQAVPSAAGLVAPAGQTDHASPVPAPRLRLALEQSWIE